MRNKNLIKQNISDQNYEENVILLALQSQKKLGKKLIPLLKEWYTLYKGFGNISFQEYIMFKLYEDKCSLNEKKRFLSSRLHWPLINKCSPVRGSVSPSDKLSTYDYLEQNGINVPKTLRVVTSRKQPYETPCQTCTNTDELRHFLTSQKPFPLFAKPNFGLLSYGVFIIDDATENYVTVRNFGPVSYETLYKNFFSDEVYLLQELLEPHPVLARFSDCVSTIRMTNFLINEDIYTEYAILKITSPDNIADAYWRKGNMLAEIDMESGYLKRTVTGKGTRLREIINHPVTGQKISDIQIPYMKEMLEFNKKIASLLPGITYQSLDIAITPQGPVLVEFNRGGGFAFSQFALNKGILTDNVIRYFRLNGINVPPL